MSEIEEIRLYYTKDLEKLLGVDRHVIYLYISAGLLTGRRIGKSWAASGEEIKQFYRRTEGMDLSNKQRIVIAGQLAKKSGRSRTPYRNHRVI